jgi:hypothetical protein
VEQSFFGELEAKAPVRPESLSYELSHRHNDIAHDIRSNSHKKKSRIILAHERGHVDRLKQRVYKWCPLVYKNSLVFFDRLEHNRGAGEDTDEGKGRAGEAGDGDIHALTSVARGRGCGGRGG